jgi:hypothetical protein
MISFMVSTYLQRIKNKRGFEEEKCPVLRMGEASGPMGSASDMFIYSNPFLSSFFRTMDAEPSELIG